MATVDERVKSAFLAMPHVDEVWVTKDGHYHLHPDNGGKIAKREDYLKEAQERVQKTAKEVIQEIEEAATKEEVEYILIGETRKPVIDAGKNKIEALAKAAPQQ
jgi:hypothetical protein